MKSNLFIFRNPILVGLLSFLLIVFFYVVVRAYLLAPSKNLISYQDNSSFTFNLIVPQKLNFCGEVIPTNNLKINRALAEEFYSNTYWKNNSAILFKKAQRWFPVIEPILAKQGIPNDFKYLAVIESHLSNVTSPAGAAGFWQLVPVSAYNYGLEVNDLIDERYHVEKSTLAACYLIKQAYGVFKNWTLAAAAYNFGINGMQKAIDCQKADNYYELLLNNETGAYVYRLMAYKTLLSSPKHFGIHKNHTINLKNNIAFKIIKVDTTIENLEAWAIYQGTSLKEIKQFNPWLMKDEILNPAHKTYELRLPKKHINYEEYLNDIVHDKSLSLNFVAKKDTLETKLVDTTHYEKTVITYVVKINEPLKNLANFFKVKEEELRKWNNLGTAENVVKGQTLTIHY